MTFFWSSRRTCVRLMNRFILDSDRDLFDARMRIVIGELKVLAAEGEDVFLGPILYLKPWKGARLAFEHSLHCVHLVYIYMSVGEAVNVFVSFDSETLSDGDGERGVLDEILRETDRHIA